ncbi:hypothetical protein HY086_06750 [Candidatus Gottesmanbacteria bacterium]|nr:hypothetical protein [Candidatus Gottesmanbacteria bacterium]
MSGYLFIFGNTPQLSHAELSVFFPSNRLITSDVAFVDQDLDPATWINRLGGTVKIAKVTAEYLALTPEEIASLLKKSDNRTFGLSSYTKKFSITPSFLRDVKYLLVSARFVLPKVGDTLSSVVVAKEKLVELVIVEEGGRWLVGRTVAIQDFGSWNRRDYGRPSVDPKAGMLPPKVARMAANLAIPAIPAFEPGSNFKKGWIPGQARNDINPILLDPFCGMGTILAEALLIGWTVIGSDNSDETIVKAGKNLEWLTMLDSRNQSPSIPGIVGSWKLLLSDATHISEKIPPESIDAIVTEPFLGSTEIGDKRSRQGGTSDTQEKVKNTIKGLEKLYIGCLKDWKKILVPGGKVVIALPEYAISGKTYFVKKVIDRCESLGYTVLLGPIDYFRPQAMVRRKFFVLQKYGTH